MNGQKIRIGEKNKERLDRRKIIERESYDDVLTKILDDLDRREMQNA